MAADLEHPSISWGRRPPPKRMRSLPRNRSRSVRTRSSTFQVLAAAIGSFALLLLHFISSFQLESILDSESILEAPMSSGAIHQRFACMGCTARRRAFFFQRLQIGSGALLAQQLLQQVHALDQGRHRSAEHTSPARWQWRGRRRWSTWRMAPPTRAIPPRRCHDIGYNIIKYVASYGYDIT